MARRRTSSGTACSLDVYDATTRAVNYRQPTTADRTEATPQCAHQRISWHAGHPRPCDAILCMIPHRWSSGRVQSRTWLKKSGSLLAMCATSNGGSLSSLTNMVCAIAARRHHSHQATAHFGSVQRRRQAHSQSGAAHSACKLRGRFVGHAPPTRCLHLPRQRFSGPFFSRACRSPGAGWLRSEIDLRLANHAEPTVVVHRF